MTTKVSSRMQRGLPIAVTSRADMKTYDVPAGYQFSLEEGGRSGLFVVKAGTPPSDPQEGIYVVLDNGNYAERIDKAPIDPSWFGAMLDGVTTDTSAWQAAITYAESVNGAIQFSGATLIDQTLTISAPIRISGSENVIQNTADRRGSYFLKGADVIGIEVTNSAGCTLSDFAVVGTGSDTNFGIKLTQCGRSKISRVSCVDNGGGIELNDGNLTSFRDIYVIGNRGTGLHVNGAATPDTNACVFSNIDARSNTGIGIDFDNAWNVFGHALVAQQNGGAGVRLNNCRQSEMSIYSEDNASGLGIELTNNANCEGNIIKALFTQSVTDNSAANQNMIFRANPSADTRAVWDLVQTDRMVIPNEQAVGSLELKHDSNVRYDFYALLSGQAHTIRWKNASALADVDSDTAIHPLRHEYPVGTITYNERIIFPDGDTTPDVSMGQFFLANNSASTTITTFDGATMGQRITVVANNGNTTLQHSSGSGIQLRSGANKTLAQYEAISFIANGTNWWIEV